MADKINDIIAQEAFEQIKALSNDLSALKEEMESIIKTSGKLKQSISSSSGVKELASNINQANNVTKTFTNVVQQATTVQNNLNNECKKVKISVEQYDEVIDRARDAMKKARNETSELIYDIMKEEKALKNIADAKKEETALVESSNKMYNSAKNAISGYAKKAEELQGVIAGLKTEKEQIAKTYGVESSQYADISDKLNSYNGLLDYNQKQQEETKNRMEQASAAIEQHTDKIIALRQEELERKATISELSVAAKQNIDLENTHIGSINEMQAILKQYTSTYASLTEEERANVEVGVPLANAINTIKEKLKEVNQEQANTGLPSDSLKSLNTELASLKNRYKELSDEERNNEAIGGKLASEINNLETQIKDITATMKAGKNGVFDYNEIVQKMMNGEINARRALRELTIEYTNLEFKRRSMIGSIEEQRNATEALARTHGTESNEYIAAAQRLQEMEQEYKELDDTIIDLTQKIGDFKDTQADIARITTSAAKDAGNIAAAVEGVGLLADGYSILKAGMAATGTESEALVEVFSRIQIIQQGLNAVNKIANTLQRESLLRLKVRQLMDKARLAIIKAQTAETTKETVAEAANTNATVANTVAETANAAAKGGNATATVGAAAATAGLTAAEGAATATSITLTGALKALGIAIKSIPVIGWILAAISALGTLTALVYKHLTAEKELTKEQKARKEIEEKTTEIKQKAIEKTTEEAIVLDRNIAKLKAAKKGTEEYKKQVKAVADQLGVSDTWLKKNIDKVDALAAAWKKVKMAQAVSETYVKAAADKQVQTESKILEMTNNTYEARKKILMEEFGYSKSEAKSAAKAKNIYNTFNDLKKNSKSYAEEMIKKSDEAEKSIEGDMKKLEDAQKASGKKVTKSATSTADKAVEYYKSIMKQLQDFENKSLSKTAKGRLEMLEKERTAELAKYNLTEEEMRKQLLKKGYTEEQITQIQLYYSKKRMEIMEEENKAINAAYSVVTLNYLSENEKRLKESTLNGEALAEALITVENARYEETKKMAQEAFNDEIKGLDENSQLYIAKKAQYDQKVLSEEMKHQDNLKKIREDAWKKAKEDLDKYYDAYFAFLERANYGGAGEVGGIMKQIDETKQAIERLDGAMNNIKSNANSIGFDVESMATQLKDAANTSKDAFSSLWNSLSVEQQSLVNSYQNTANSITENQEQLNMSNLNMAESYVSMASKIGNSFNSIGENMQKLAGESVGLTITMQAVAMAQILASQGVAVAKAIESAINTVKSITEDPGKTSAVKIAAIAGAAATVAGAIAAVIGQMASAKSAIQESKQALSATSVSAYAEGTQYHKGGSAVVGEGNGPELVLTNGKSYVIDKPTLIKDLPVGAKVLPLEAAQMRSMNETDLSEVLATMNIMSGKLDNRERVSVNVGKNVYSYIVKGSNRARVLSKQFSC